MIIDVIKEFRNEYGFLSNFYTCDILFNNILYKSSEHAYQAQKAVTKEDKQKFTQNITAGEAKRLGKELKQIKIGWDQQLKLDIMVEIIKAKFTQNPELNKLLKDTKNKLLIEGNTWHDNFWGDCYCKKCINKNGKNILGKILMLTRVKI